MSQEEVYNLLKKHPRLCSREISEILNESLKLISKTIRKMIDKDVIGEAPNRKEMEKLLKKYPNLKYYMTRIKVFEVKDE